LEITHETPNLSLLSEIDLLRLHNTILNELWRRKVIRTNNNPLGDYAEWLVADKLNFKLETSSQSGHDATDINGVRYQIKARKLSEKNKSTQLGAIRNLAQHDFDFLIAILFDSNYEIILAVSIPWECISKYARYQKHTNSSLLYLQNPLLSDTSVVNIKDRLLGTKLS
jgi:hypothetical protein